LLGKHKISFWETRFSDDSYFSPTDNSKSNIGELFFQLESFMRPVEHHDEPDIDKCSEEDTSNKISTIKEGCVLPSDEKIIENISKQTPFQTLSPEEKEVLWRNRYTVINNQELICKLLKCVNKRDVQHLKETEILTKVK
jgi:hypothetical protein